MMLDFSIIIPVFNREDLIEATINSILKCSYPELEIIVVDDGSTDRTLEVLSKYGDRIKILQQKNKGPGAARNLGIAAAKGEYILFLDSDDLWFPWSIDTFIKAIARHQKPALIGGLATRFEEVSEVDGIKQSSIETEYFLDYYQSSQKPLWLLNGAVAIKTEELRKVGGFTNKWINAEDSDLWLKLGIAKGFVFIQSPVVLAYRSSPNSAVTNTNKTYEGAWHLIKQEKQNLYPGGHNRQKERLEILMRHIRPVSLAYLREGNIRDAWKMYRETFSWNFSLGRFVYLLAFLFILVKTYSRKKIFNFSFRPKIKYGS